LLEGLEVTERKLSGLERTLRIDAEFFQRRHLAIETKLASAQCSTVAEVALVADGNHFSISESFVKEGGVPYYRGQDVVGHFFIEQANPNRITREAFEQSFIRRSHLKQGDVLLSIIGTVGETSLVKTKQDATCSCKLAILRPKCIEPAYLATFLSSAVGRALTERWKRGAVQTGLLLEDMDQVPVPRFSKLFEGSIASVVTTAYEALNAGVKSICDAELSLLRALGLDGWEAPDPLTYILTSRDAFTAGRLDAEFFTPRVRDMLTRLGRDGLTIHDVAPARKERFTPADSGNFRYIEIGGLGADGTAQAECLPQREAPCRATQYVRAGDVITSTVRPIRRLSAAIDDSQDGYVCSSGFVVLQPRAISSDVLLTYLRLPPVCALMNLHTSASLYPAISEADLLALPVPNIPAATQQAIEKSALAARHAKRRATQLLAAAKRAVEIAVEDSEAAALTYLAGVADAAASCDDSAHVTLPSQTNRPTSRSMARPVPGRGQSACRVSGKGAGFHGQLDGAGERTGGSGASAGPAGSTQPLNATRELATAAGPKPYSEVAEALAENVGRCLEEILDADPSAIALNAEWLRDVHRRIAGELFPDWAGRFRSTDVQVGAHFPPPARDVPVRVRDFCLDLEERLRHLGSAESLAELLAWADWRFQWIHPFKDFNGRVGRIMLIALAFRLGLPPIDPAGDMEGKQGYFRALRAADAGDLRPLTEIWLNRL